MSGREPPGEEPSGREPSSEESRTAGTELPKVLIIGAGFGGLAAAKALAKSAVEVTVIDQRNHHTFQPLLYQVATAGLDVDDICYTTRGIFHRQRNARAMQGQVTDVDFDRRLVTTAEGPPLAYDHLILAVGAITADFGVPGVAEHAFGLKAGAEAMQIRSHVLRNFERAERAASTVRAADTGRAAGSGRAGEPFRDADTTIVIVGGGPTGVEMAGGFAELIAKPLRRDFPLLDTSEARVVLVEGQDRLLASFAPKLGNKALKRLIGMGVDVRLSTQVDEVDRGAVRFSDGTSIATTTVVWAAGVRAHPLAAALGLETTRGGRVAVDEQLRVLDQHNVYAIGDVAASPGPDDELVPQVAPGAVQGGQHVAELITAEIEGGQRIIEPFRYRDKGSMATIGRNAAVVELPTGAKISGFPGWVAWLALHLVMLIGFRNRANVLVNWAWNYLTYDRGSRLIIELDDKPTA